jgi:hypothetical protein
MAFLTFQPFYADSSAPERVCQIGFFCCRPPGPPPWLPDGAQSGSGSRLARAWLRLAKRAFRVDCLHKWSSIGILIFHCMHSGGSIGIMGARKPCKFHAFLMTSVPALFSISFCFPPHTLRLLANRRFACMRAHILPLVSSVFFAQGWARLQKQFRGARDLSLSLFPFSLRFCSPFVLPSGPLFGAQGRGTTPKSNPMGPTSGFNLGRF